MGILDAALNFGARAMQSLESGASNRQQSAPTNKAEAPETQRPKNAMADERVTLADRETKKANLGDLPIREYKDYVARDSNFVKETVGTKLSELDVDLGTRLSVRKNSLGDLEVDAKIPAETRDRIESDLNQNRAFKAAFNRLSVNQPTVEYLDNVSRISQAYGEGNSMLESIVSENPENNSLQDLAHRYQELRKQVASEDGMPDAGSEGYEIRFNAQA